MNNVAICQDPLISIQNLKKKQLNVYICTHKTNKQTIKDGMLSFKVRRSISSVCSRFLKVFSVDVHSCKAKINRDGNWKGCFWSSDAVNNANVLQIF